jgi:rubredoxin
MSRPSPHELWRQAQAHAGDSTDLHYASAAYVKLMMEHGYIIPSAPIASMNVTNPNATPASKDWRELEPVPMYLTCPKCSAQHVDVGVFATKVHRDHACQSCGLCWRPALVPTVGMQHLPGYKNEP